MPTCYVKLVTIVVAENNYITRNIYIKKITFTIIILVILLVLKSTLEYQK